MMAKMTEPRLIDPAVTVVPECMRRSCAQTNFFLLSSS